MHPRDVLHQCERAKSGVGSICALFVTLIVAGTAWGQVIPGPRAILNSDTDPGADMLPRFATDGNGNWVTVWNSNADLGGLTGTDWDIFVASSGDNGATWSATAALNSTAVQAEKDDLFPNIATGGNGTWIAVWDSLITLGGTLGIDNDLFFARSTDNGANWATAAPLNTTADTDIGADINPDVCADGNGNWVAVWSSGHDVGGTGFDVEILVARSSDDGVMWTDPEALNSTASDDDFLHDGQPRIATDGAGLWAVVWEIAAGSSAPSAPRQIASSFSTDNGETWSAVAFIEDQQVEQLRPSVSTSAGGTWMATWYSHADVGGLTGDDSDIYYSRGTGNPIVWSEHALLNSNGSADGTDRSNGTNDFDPVLSTDGQGNWIGIWEAEEWQNSAPFSPSVLMFASSADDGLTWTVPVAFNTDVLTGTVDELEADLATDGNGQWACVFRSSDILISRFNTNDPMWVNFGHVGTERGSSDDSYSTLGDAVDALFAGGLINIKGGVVQTTSSESLTITKPMSVTSSGGSVQIGVP